ncbi:MAG: hypothetical protein FWF46_05965 [Oscillospiraceae bacterium]|nr:hypothetical protein [Oscillospiraceae bacterium]
MKKNFYLILILIIVLLLICVGYVIYPKYSKDLEWTQEYVIGNPGIIGDVSTEMFGDNPAYEIGANQYGYAVFKNPDKAFKQFKKDYADAMEFIKEQFDIPLYICKFNYQTYGAYGWQINTEDENLRYKAFNVTAFVDIFENSFAN